MSISALKTNKHSKQKNNKIDIRQAVEEKNDGLDPVRNKA